MAWRAESMSWHVEWRPGERDYLVTSEASPVTIIVRCSEDRKAAERAALVILGALAATEHSAEHCPDELDRLCTACGTVGCPHDSCACEAVGPATCGGSK